MQVEIWRVPMEHREDEWWIELPETFDNETYVLVQGLATGSVMLFEESEFERTIERIQEKAARPMEAMSVQGRHLLRFFMMSSSLAEVEERWIALPPMLAETMRPAEEWAWLVRTKEPVDIWARSYLATDESLLELLKDLEIKIG